MRHRGPTGGCWRTAPVTYFEGRHHVAARLLACDYIAASGDGSGTPTRGIADVTPPSTSTRGCEERPSDLIGRALQQQGGDVTFVIGGADGLDADFKKNADMLLRVSSLTLPHGMVRVLLAEQLYRAWTFT
jgi:hypothetical protein